MRRKTYPSLTDLTVKNAAPKSAAYEIPDGTVAGLKLRIGTGGAKSWCVRYTIHGRNRKLTLGNYPVMKLPVARTRASAALLAVAAGRDPAGEKREQRFRAIDTAARSIEFTKAYALFQTRYEKPRLGESTVIKRGYLYKKHLAPAFTGKPIAAIGVADVKKLTDSLLDASKPTSANHVFKQLRLFFKWCVDQDYIDTNPLAGKKQPAPERSRNRVLSSQEIAWFWRAAEELGYPYGPLLQLLFLTAARRAEVAGMTREEIDLIAGLWSLPAERVKNNHAHTIHLSPLAVETIKRSPRILGNHGPIFTPDGERPCRAFGHVKKLIDASMREQAGRIEIKPWVFHDLRRTAATTLGKLRVPLEVTEAVLNHKSGSRGGIVGVYQRFEYLDERKEALQKLADHVSHLLTTIPDRRK